MVFSGEELFWLAKLNLECDSLNTYVLNNHVFNGDVIKTFTTKKISRLVHYKRVGCKSDIAKIIWDSDKLNQQRHGFFQRLIDLGVLVPKRVVNRLFYEFDDKKSFEVFKESSRGKIMFDFFDKNCTIVVE